MTSTDRVRSWRDVAAQLAGPDSYLAEGEDPAWEGMVVAEAAVSGERSAALRVPGATADEAWRAMAHGLGRFRLLQSLEGARWTVEDEVIDETTYVIARDPDGALWAIGVAEGDGTLGRHIELAMRHDERWPEIVNVAFLHPLDTETPQSLTAALASRRRSGAVADQ